MKITDCQRCPLWSGSGHCISGTGTTKSGIVVIAESPGRLEVHQETEDIPLIGESGAIFNWATNKAGLTKSGRRDSAFYLTNAVKCFPSTTSDTTNPVEVKVDLIKGCRHWLVKELKHIKPKLILTMGGPALKSVSGNYSNNIEAARGFWYWSSEFNCYYLPTIHPASVLRSWGKTSSFCKDIERFTSAVKTGVPKPQVGKKYTVLKKLSQVETLFKFLKKTGRVAWDVEATSTEFWDPKVELLGIGFCWREGSAAYVPVVGEDCCQIWTDSESRRIFTLFKEFFEDRNVLKDGQNTKFDINWMRRHDIKVRGVDWDTMQYHHLLDENTPANLTYMTTYYDLNFPPYESEIKPYIKKENDKKTYRHVPTDLLGKYCCADCDAVFRISKIQRGAKYKQFQELYYDLGVSSSRFAAEIEWNGVLIDVERITELENEYQKQIDVKNKELSDLLKRKNFNVKSNPQMQDVLYGEGPTSLNLKVVFKTKKGNPSTDATAFERLRRNYANRKKVIKVLKLISEVRTMRTMKSTYLTGFLKLVDSANRVHTSYLTAGPVTGRLASVSPNLQNIPRNPIFRSLFIAAAGRKFTAADYSQIEARMLAWLAIEEILIKKFGEPDFDPHYYNSSVVRRKSIDQVTKEERSTDKAVTFGMNYGRSAKSISEEYDLPLKFVEDFISSYFREFKKISKWRELQVQTAKEKGYLANNDGRYRRFDAFDWIYGSEMEEVTRLRKDIGESNWLLSGIIGNMSRQAINFPIQSHSWAIMVRATKRVLNRIKKEGLDAKLVLTVHDMLGTDSKNEDTPALEIILKEEMPVIRKRRNKRTGEVLQMCFGIDYEVAQCWVQ